MIREKVSALCSSDLSSHPGKKLIDHMERVADACVSKFIEDQPDLGYFFHLDHWKHLVWIMGFFHDIGKATPFFQDYLAEKDEDKKRSMKSDPLTSHALLSAVIAHFLVSRYSEAHSQESDLWRIMPLFVFLCIKRHHGNPGNAFGLKGSDNELDGTDPAHLDHQYQACSKEAMDGFLAHAAKTTGFKLSVDDFPASWQDYCTKFVVRTENRTLYKLQKNTAYYFIFQYLFSLLLHSDKEEAIFSGSVDFTRRSIPDTIVRDYITREFGKPEGRMNRIRSEMFDDADRSAMNTDIVSNHVFSLNVPTGTGKTFTSLSVALRLRTRMEKDGRKPRIIYALPFTSIIDQNHDVFKEVLADPDSSVLLKHHHLADMCYTAGEGEFETGESKFLIESWTSEVIVTTMFQVFHTLFTNKNKMIQKFRMFANAIVLLDEVQSLPYTYWNLARNAMECMARLFHTRFILITATQPKIYDDHEIAELVPDKQRYFSQLDRVTLTFHETPLTLSEYTERCRKEVQSSGESFLFVMNTVNSAMVLYNALSGADKDADYVFLATNIIPAHRLQRIRDIKDSKKRKIIVSTQMIEAGVDIDVENVWRDSGPLESINQVCGRCNRHFASERKGRVCIFQILDENNRNTPFEKYVYGKNALSMLETKTIISKKPDISETEFLQNMDRYYSEIQSKQNNDGSNKVHECMDNLQFQGVYDSFHFIDPANYDQKDVFIEWDDKARNVWGEFLSIRAMGDPIKRKEAFLKIRKDFYDYVLSLPAKYVPDQAFDGTFVVYASHESLPACYEEATGWKRDTTGTLVF